MNASNVAFLDTKPTTHVREERGDYDKSAGLPYRAKHLYKAQGLVGDALNLAGLMRKSLDDEGDTRAMQIDTAVRVIEKKLQKAYRQLDKYQARHLEFLLDAQDAGSD